MAILRRAVRTKQPTEPTLVDFSNPLNRGIAFAYSFRGNLFDAVRKTTGVLASNTTLPYFAMEGIYGGLQFNGVTNNRVVASSGRILGGSPNFTVCGGVYDHLDGGPPHPFYCERGSSGNDILKIVSLATVASVMTFRNDAGNLINQSGTIAPPSLNAIRHIAFTYAHGGSATLYMNGVLDTAVAAVANENFTDATVESWIGADHGDATPHMFGKIVYVFGWKRTLSRLEVLEIARNPWQIYQRKGAQPVIPLISTSQDLIGGGSDTLQPIQETSAGNIGAINTFGTETLKAITETSAGAIGLKSATDIETLKPITAAATGVVVSTVDAGYGSATLQPITQLATGKIGAVTGAADVLRAVVMQATGQIGLIGTAVETLQPIQGFATGISAAPAIQPTQQGGAPAWWGYEGFDGTQRPWWYRDLKDKARELERLRLLRIELGILPKPQARKIARVVRETEDFADEYPTPARADEYMARADAVFDKVQKLIDDLQEQDDEKMIAELSKKFFFDRRQAWLRQ